MRDGGAGGGWPGTGGRPRSPRGEVAAGAPLGTGGILRDGGPIASVWTIEIVPSLVM